MAQVSEQLSRSADDSLSKVLQTEQVKRLFNQPNITIKTLPLDSGTVARSEAPTTKGQIEISIVPIVTSAEDSVEEANLLPSKNGGKSEIALVPVSRGRKDCEHDESCEEIVCEVAVSIRRDSEDAVPMLASGIDDDEEIDAPVAKHCADSSCDALSIDHDRCRRATVRIGRCDESASCDLCGVPLLTYRSRARHRDCARKDEYRHNEASGAQVLRERMRLRERELNEESRTAKHDYSNPIIGHRLAMETLGNNKELIIIPNLLPKRLGADSSLSTTLVANPANPLFSLASPAPTDSSWSKSQAQTTPRISGPNSSWNLRRVTLNDWFVSQSNVIMDAFQQSTQLSSLAHTLSTFDSIGATKYNSVSSQCNASTVKDEPENIAVGRVKGARKQKKDDAVCGYCSKHFCTKYYLKVHVAKHESKIAKLAASRKRSVDGHQEAVNNHRVEGRVERRSRECPDCSKRYTLAARLKRHRRKVHGLVECERCNGEWNEEDFEGHAARCEGRNLVQGDRSTFDRASSPGDEENSQSEGNGKILFVESQKQYAPNDNDDTPESDPLATSKYIQNVQSISLNDWLASQSSATASPNDALRASHLLRPVRVVPIANLITPPSLLHQTHGVPKFCFVSDGDAQNEVRGSRDEKRSNVKTGGREVRKNTGKRRRGKAKKNLVCDYCSKKFSTRWYFKVHLANHLDEKPFRCDYCKLTFNTRYKRKKHVIEDHKEIEDAAFDEEEYDEYY